MNNNNKKKLWELMLDGCKKYPKQVYRMLYDNNDGACALGALLSGYSAYKNEHYAITNDELLNNYPLLYALQKCPIKNCMKSIPKTNKPNLYSIIIHLNDTHKWTREAIAGWLMTEIEKDTKDITDKDPYAEESNNNNTKAFSIKDSRVFIRR